MDKPYNPQNQPAWYRIQLWCKRMEKLLDQVNWQNKRYKKDVEQEDDKPL
nr:MAG TPA: hypothetical protein [Caudoviricetes sp.]